MATSTWEIDPVHSSAAFSLEYMTIALFRRRFEEVSGTIALDESKPENSMVSATIPVTSVNVQLEHLRGWLLGENCFIADQFPAITFKSTRVKKVDDKHWQIGGDLTMRGVTRPVALDTEYLGQAKHPFSGQMRAGFRVTGAIKRGDFNMTWNAAMDAGGQYLGEKVNISLEIMAGKKE